MLYRLIIITGPRKGERITVHPEPLVIGREPGCDVVLDDDELARRHAEVAQTDAGLAIRDLGTMNRILVNQHEVTEAKLKHGDVVEIGHTRFLVQVVVQAEVNGIGPAAARRRRTRRRIRIGSAAALLAAGVYAVWPQDEDTPEPPPVAVEAATPEPAPGPSPTAEPLLLEPPVPWREIPMPPPADPDTEAELMELREHVASLRQTLAAISATGTTESPAPAPAPASEQAGFRFETVRMERFPASGEYEDQRKIRIVIAHDPAHTPDLDQLRVRAVFYEQDRGTRAIRTSAADPAAAAMLTPGREPGRLLADLTYTVPAGYGADQQAAGRDPRYAGCRLALLLGETVLAESIAPPALARELEAP